MIKEAIILAGGLGTRLRAAVPDLPKCMAPVLAKPFIGYLVDHLLKQGIERFIFSLGYKYQVVEQYINTQYGQVDLAYSVEKELLGTGGAIRQACRLAVSENVLVFNGDTFFRVDLEALSLKHTDAQADCTLCVKPMYNFDRFSHIELNQDGSVHSFREKEFTEKGYISGGIYALAKEPFLHENLPDKFSFEKEYLEKFTTSRRFYALIQDNYFIDIGIPEDFERAQTELLQHI